MVGMILIIYNFFFLLLFFFPIFYLVVLHKVEKKKERGVFSLQKRGVDGWGGTLMGASAGGRKIRSKSSVLLLRIVTSLFFL